MKIRMLRLISLLVLLTLAVHAPLSALAEEPDPYEVFLSMAGNITFTMDLQPMLYYDADLLPDEIAGTEVRVAWRNKVQLHCSTEGSEVQYHIAEIGETVELLAAEEPAMSDEMIRANALLRFAAMTVSITGASEGAGEPVLTLYDETTRYPVVKFDYTYSDMPEVVFHCVGILDGNTAVLMLGNECERFDRLLSRFGIASGEQLARYEEFRRPQTETLGLLSVTFPAGAWRMEQTGGVYIIGFTRGYELFTAEYMAVDFEQLFGVKMTDGDLLEVAEYTGENGMEGYGADSFDASLFADGIAVLKYHYEADPMDPFPYEIRCFFTRSGVYTFYGSVTEEGMAYLNSIAVAEE